MWPGRRPTSIPSGILIHPAVWPQQTWAGSWGALPLFSGGGAGSPSKTVWSKSRPTRTPSFILICPTVWPQYTNVTERQTGQDNGPIAQGKQHYKWSCTQKQATLANQMWWLHFKYTSAESKSSLILGWSCGLTIMTLQLKTRSTGADEAGTQNSFSNRRRMTS